MLSGERKKFALRSARKPMILDGLSNTVIVVEGGTLHYCFIAFDASFAAAAGAKMPRGVSSANPAFVQVTHDARSGKWVVAAVYVANWEARTLWMSDHRPAWIKELKQIKVNQHDSTDQTTGTPSGHRRRGHASALYAA